MRTTTRRVGWGVADQALSSLTNFVVLVVAAGVASRADFGALAVGLAVTVTIIGVARAIAGEPLTVRFSTASRGQLRAAARAALGVAMGVGIAGGAVVGVAGAVTGGTLGTTLGVLAIVLPGLVLQDICRFVLMAEGRPKAAVLSDSVWLVSQVITLAAVSAFGEVSVAIALLVWGITGNFAGAVALVHSRLAPTLHTARQWLSDQRDLWPRFTGEVLALTGSWQVALVGLGAIVGLDAVGALRAAQVLLGPLNVAFLAVPLVMVPESSRLWRRGQGAPPQHALAISGALALLALVWGAAAALIPSDTGRSLLGASWHGARALVVPVALVMASVGVTLGALTGLRVLGAAHDSLRARMLTAAIVVAGIVSGGVVDGARGAAWGWAIAATIGAAIWWSSLHRVWRRHEAAGSIPTLAVIA